MSTYYSTDYPYQSIGNNYSVQIYDNDNDGFYNWGIGPKPANCPPCPDERDGNDDDPSIGPFISSGYMSYLLPHVESFEEGLENWIQLETDDINWIRRSGSTPSSNTGPSSAYDGTYYLYFEASRPDYQVIPTAEILSPMISLEGVCSPSLSFYYHMYGATMGTFEIFISTNQGASWTSIWSKTGDQGNSWQYATVNLSSYLGDQVLFKLKGTTGSSYTGDIAIDNIKIKSNPPSGTTYITSNTTWSNYSTLCNNLVIQYGSKLTITGTLFSNLTNSITLDYGSTLEIDGGSLIHGNIIVNTGSTLSIKNNGNISIIDEDAITINSSGILDITSGGISILNR
jgi:hypothetical protein